MNRIVGRIVDEAEDLLQETLLHAWLYKIATNTCLDFLRRVERRPRAYAPVPGMDDGNGPAPDFLEWLRQPADARTTRSARLS